MLDSWNLSITAEEFTASCACYLHHSLLPQTITDLLVNYRVIILRLTLLEKILVHVLNSTGENYTKIKINYINLNIWECYKGSNSIYMLKVLKLLLVNITSEKIKLNRYKYKSVCRS